MSILTFIANGFQALLATVHGAVQERRREHLETVLDRGAAEYEAQEGQTLAWRDGLVDTLKAAGFDSSKAFRKRLADEAGIKSYTGTAEQNTALRAWLIAKLQAPPHNIPIY
jgi:hypothetical protein